MDPITLTSIPYDYSVTVDKTELLRLFPDSLFGLILDQDPATLTIEIPSDVVTPVVLNTIAYMIETSDTPDITAGSIGYYAGRYLLMDVLIAMSDPSYILLRKRYHINLLDDKNLDKFYKQILWFCYEHGSVLLAQYLFEHVPVSDRTQFIDQRTYNTAIGSCRHELVPLLIRRGVSVSYEDLIVSIEQSCPKIVKILLQDPEIDPGLNDNRALILAATLGQSRIIRILLRDPRVNLAAHYNEAIQRATSGGHLNAVKVLMSDKRVNPSTGSNYPLRTAERLGRADIVKQLLTDPRVMVVYENPPRLYS